MKLLFIEFITGGGLNKENLPASLASEGEAMYQAILRDLRSYSHIEIISTRDPRLETPVCLSRCDFDVDIWSLWESLMKECDAALLIAPETEGVLLKLTELAQRYGCRLLGSQLEAVSICSDKHQTLSVLEQNAIPTVPTDYFTPDLFDTTHSVVLKPNNGAGAEDCYLIREDISQKSLQAIQQRVQDSADSITWISQPYLEATHASMTLCCSQYGAEVLAVNEQMIQINKDGLFQLTEIHVNSLQQLQPECQLMAEKIHAVIPGLYGIVGIDFLFHKNQILILEVNPRPVSSYVKLRRSIMRNPLDALFKKNYTQPTEKHQHAVTLELCHA